MLVSCLRGDLPPASLASFLTDATGGYLRYVTARPATKAPVTSLYLRGRRCAAAQHCTYRNLCCTAHAACVPGTLRTAARRSQRSRPVEVHGRCDPCLHEDPGQVDRGANRPGPPVPPQWQMTTHHPGNLRRHCVLAPTKTASSGRPSDEGVTGRSPEV